VIHGVKDNTRHHARQSFSACKQSLVGSLMPFSAFVLGRHVHTQVLP